MPKSALAPKVYEAVPEELPTEDLLALVSGCDRVRELLGRYGLRDLQNRSEVELTSDGLSLGGARRLAGAFEIARRLAERRVTRGEPLRSSRELFEAFHARMRDLKVERFMLVMVDAKNRIMGEALISQGSLTSSLVHPREVFRPAIRAAASGVVVLHNHPSGDPEPSPEDQEITKRLDAVGDVVGIRVLDHIVIGDGAYVSFLDRGWIAP